MKKHIIIMYYNMNRCQKKSFNYLSNLIRTIVRGFDCGKTTKRFGNGIRHGI